MAIDEVRVTDTDRLHMSDKMLEIFEKQEKEYDERQTETCYTCGETPNTSILLSGDEDRWFLPNKGARQFEEWVTEIWLCHGCLGQIEDEIRSKIQELTKRGER